MFGKKKASPGGVPQYVLQARADAAEAGLGEEAALYVAKPAHPKGGDVIAFFEHGFVQVGPIVKVVRWADVKQVEKKFRTLDSGARELSQVTLVPDGLVGYAFLRRKTFDSWPDVDAGEVLRRVCAGAEQALESERRDLDDQVSRTAEQAVRTITAGERVPFGAVSLDGEGVHASENSVRWADLVSIRDFGAVLMLFTPESEFKPALYLPAADLPDAPAFIAVAERMHQLRQPPQALTVHRSPNLRDATVLTALANLVNEPGSLVPPDSVADTVATMRAKATMWKLAGTPRWYPAAKGARKRPEKALLALYNDGFVMSLDGEVSTHRWFEISQVTVMLTTASSGPRNRASVTDAKGRSLVDESVFPGIGGYVSQIRAAQTGYLLHEAFAAFAKETRFALGAVTVDREGFTYQGRTTAWSAVRSVRNNYADPYRTHDAIIVGTDVGKPLTVRHRDLTNGPAFETILGIMTR